MNGAPLEYEVAAEWDTIGGMQIQSGVFCAPDQAPLARLTAGDAPVAIRNADDPSLPESARRACQSTGAKSALILPMHVRGRFEGLMIGMSPQPAPIREGDVRFAQAVAEQLSVVFGGLRATDETQAALERVEILNRRLSGEAWRTYLAARSGGLSIESSRLSGADAASRVAAPIVVRGETLGMLALEDADANRQWTDEEWDLLTTVAGEVAQAMENARLIEQTQERAARQSQLNAIAQRIRRAASIESILDIAAEELGRALDTSHAQAALGAPALFQTDAQGVRSDR
jgi:GAF domain-containing protein